MKKVQDSYIIHICSFLKNIQHFSMDAQKLLDNFSSHLKNTIAYAISTATRLNMTHVEPLHLLHALCQEKGCVAYELLRKYDITQTRVEENSTVFVVTQDITTTHIPELSSTARTLVEKALILSHEHGHSYIGTEHLLYAIMHAKTKQITTFFNRIQFDNSTILEQLDISLQNVSRFSQMNDIMDMIENLPDDVVDNMNNMNLPPPMSLPAPSHMLHGKQTKKPSALAQYATNLSSKQQYEKIDVVIGRDEEIERIITILARRSKNNPILVGEPGVGKTAIVEGLAKRIANGDVPDILKQKKIYALDLTLLIAGTIYRGEFEARLKSIVDECSHNPHCILFIDEIHNIIGAGSNQGTMDAANILKPALARGLLHCIGATTDDEYHKYISSDPALQRRFQRVTVEEPSEIDTRHILDGIALYYESYHHVIIDTSAKDEALRLSTRYIHDNFQPDKSIDLLDEACAYVRSQQKASLIDIKKQAHEQALDQLYQDKEHAIIKERLKDAIRIKKEIETIEKKLKSIDTEEKPIKKIHVQDKDIRHVLATKMHIDEALLAQNEWERIKTLKQALQTHIIGQDETLDAIIKTLSHTQLKKINNKPLASFLFVGPSGVGKTALAKYLAQELYYNTDALIQLNMSEFSEGHSVSRILGSPAGYVGYKDRNIILEKIQKHPYCILLFDEIDKAHPDVIKQLLHMLEEGYISGSNGKKVSLAHAIIILTSNMGAEFFTSPGIGFGEHNKTKQDSIKKYIQEQLGQALTQRIQEICIFNPLTSQHIQEIFKMQLDDIIHHIKQTQKIAIKLDNSTLDALLGESNTRDARHIQQRSEQLLHKLVSDILSKKIHKKTYTLVHKKDYTLI